MRHSMFSVLFVFVLVFNEQFAFATRTFYATPKNTRLRRRALSFEPRYDNNAIYYAEGLQDDFASSAVKIMLNPKQPMLIHEDVHDHITSVRCTAGRIYVSFASSDIMLQAQREWDTGASFLFVSADNSCAMPGEHSVHTVFYKSLGQSGHTIVLEANSSSLRGSSHDLYIELGQHIASELQSSTAPPLLRRQEPDAPSSTIVQDSSTTTIQIPPIAVETTTNTTQDLSFSKTNFTLLPPSPDMLPILPNASSNALVKLICANCTMTGQVGLSVAGFTLRDADQNVDIMDLANTVKSFAHNGFFEFFANNVSGHFDFDFNFEPGFTLSTGDSLAARLPDIAVTPIQIPGIIIFGPVIEFPITITATLTSELSISAGFDFYVPDNSTAVLNVTDIGSSYSTGFRDARLVPLPFDMNSKNFRGQITTTLQPRFALKASIGDIVKDFVDVEGKAGVYLDLPAFIANFTTLEDVNENCTGTAAAGFENDTYVSIDYFAQLSTGVFASLKATMSVAYQSVTLIDKENETTIFATDPLPLGNTCLLWDESSAHLVKAEAQIKPTPSPLPSPTVSTGAPSSSSAKSKSGAPVTYTRPSLANLCAWALVLIVPIYTGML